MDIDVALQQGTYIPLGCYRHALSNHGEWFAYWVHFSSALAASLKQHQKAAKSEQPQVVVFGEAVALLQAEGKADAAIRLERK